MKLAATIVGSMKADMQAEMRGIEKAVAAGVKEAGDGLKGSLRKQVVTAGLGSRLARAWRSRAWPNKGHDAASLVWTKAPQIIRTFDEGTVIRSKSGFWLAIPTPAAPKRGVGGKRITPSNFPEHRFGPLRFVYRARGPSLLVVDGVRVSAKTGRVGRRAKGGRFHQNRPHEGRNRHGGHVLAGAPGPDAETIGCPPGGGALVAAAAVVDRPAHEIKGELIEQIGMGARPDQNDAVLVLIPDQ